LLAIVGFLALSLRFTDYLFQLPQSFFSPYLMVRPGLGLVSFCFIIFFGPQLAFAVLSACLGWAISANVSKRSLNSYHTASAIR
jgi:hypothetical protein